MRIEQGKENKGEWARDGGSNVCQRQAGKGDTEVLLLFTLEHFEFTIVLMQILFPTM